MTRLSSRWALEGRSRAAGWRRLGGSRREPPGAPREATVCVLDTSPGSPTARCVRCAGSLLDGLHLWFVHAWCYSLVPMGMGCWLGAALRRLPLLRLSEISSNDFDWMLRMETTSLRRCAYIFAANVLNPCETFHRPDGTSRAWLYSIACRVAESMSGQATSTFSTPTCILTPGDL